MLSGKCVCGISWLVGIQTSACDANAVNLFSFYIFFHFTLMRGNSGTKTRLILALLRTKAFYSVLLTLSCEHFCVKQHSRVSNRELRYMDLILVYSFNMEKCAQRLQAANTQFYSRKRTIHENNLVGCALTPPSMPMFHAYVLHKCSPKHPCRSIDFECMVCVFFFIRFLSRPFSIFRGNEQTLRTLKNTSGVRPYQMKRRRFSQMCACECIVPPSSSYST